MGTNEKHPSVRRVQQGRQILRPAILYKEQIEREFMKYFYTMDMFYETGSLESWIPNIKSNSDGYEYQYAITNSNEELIGYLSYCIDFYSGNMSRFGLISFERGNALIGKAVFEEIERCINEYHLHRVEWRMVGGNPAENGYDAFLKKHNGNKHILKDAVKDRYGKYHDDVIYEIIL